MDIEQGSNIPEGSQGSEPVQIPVPPPVEKTPVPPAAAKAPVKRSGWRIFWNIILVFSILANIVLVLMLIGLAGVFVSISSERNAFTEEAIQRGPHGAKIAIININGIIQEELSQEVSKQLKMARDDDRVKGLIIRVNSPGGTISGSDQIYNEIVKYRKKTGKPVVALMEGVAASGGYYTSVACDKIVAEPTTITGSIGVIMGHFVLQQLLEEKLGIQPVIVKSGPKKDWPSPFHQVTEEERQYIQQKLITPAYERFVKVVADGRKELTVEDVRRLGDGSIYGAQEALEDKLIDRIGYLDDAIDTVKSLAGIEKAQVIEYRKPFSLIDLLGAQSTSTLKFDKNTLYKFYSPQVLYLWTLN
jgi:protease IV